MAAPTDPTATTIVTEAFNRTGIASPSSAKITRAETYWLEEVKDDIWKRATTGGKSAKFKTLQTSEVDITTVGISKYAFPSDFDSLISISLLTGSHTGTAQTGASTTVTLEDEEDAAETSVVGHYILITGGTAENELRQCSAYDTDTYIATISPAWGTNPDSTSTYRIIDQAKEISQESLPEIGSIGGFASGLPSAFAKVYEDEYDRFILNIPPDASTYGLLMRYYANIHKIDITGTLMTKIYRNWRNSLVLGVAMKVAEDEDDTKYALFAKQYEVSVFNLIAKELPYEDQFEGFEL